MKILKHGALWMLAASFLAFAGCEEEPANGPNDPEQPSGPVVLTASIETGDTKVGAEVNEETFKVAFKWTAGDAIAVQTASGFENFAYTGSASAASGEFSAEAQPLLEGIAVFPAAVAASVSDDALTLNLPATYTYDAGQTNALLTASITPDNNLWFTHIGGLVAVGLENIPAGAQLVFTAEGMKINGTFTMALDSVTPVVDAVSTETASESTITISFPEAVAEGIAYFPVPVGYYASWKGQIVGPDQTVLLELERESAQAERAVATAFNDVPEVMLDLAEWFVTPEGAGDKTGSSWDNAMGVTELRTMLAQRVDAEGAQIDKDAHAVAAVLDGDTFHMAAGDYYLAGEAGAQVKVEFTDYEKEVAMTFLGGYPANLTGTAKEGRNAETNVTAFTGNKEAGIFVFGNQTDITFDGLTFKDAKFSANSGAIVSSAGASGECTLTVNNCKIIDNANDDAHTGAGIQIHKSTVTVTDCYFTGNYARNGSCINLNKSEGTVAVTGCTFENNSTANTSGAVQNGGTDVTITGCTFKNNTANSWGGAFHTNGDGANTVFAGCVFEKNTAGKNGGAVTIQNGTCTFTDCRFIENVANQAWAEGAEKNTCKAGGAIALLDVKAPAKPVCTINSCTFTGNSAPYGQAGAILAYENFTLNINAGTSFIDNTALYDGGAINASNVFKIAGTSTSKVTFSGNKTLETGSGVCNGGAMNLWARNAGVFEMDHVLFSNNQAGTESGSTIYYSNGGVIRLSGNAHLDVENCEFTGNRGRNGGCVSLNATATSTFKNCDFHDNLGRSGADKTGTAGWFCGAVGQIDKGAVEFTECKFTNNEANTPSVLHMNGDDVKATFTDCELKGNVARNVGMIYMEKAGIEVNMTGCLIEGNSTKEKSSVLHMAAKNTATLTNCIIRNNSDQLPSKTPSCIGVSTAGAKLYVNGCLLEGNQAASRGIIQTTTNALVYLNDVTFKDNYTTDEGNSWGVNMHGNGITCMNNVTSYNNYNKNLGTGNSVVSFNGDGGWLAVNSTLIDKTPLAIVRGNGSRKTAVCNNIVINTLVPDKNFLVANSSNFVDGGHNVLSCSGAHNNATPVSTDLLSQSETTLGGGSYSANWTATHPYGVYLWTNALTNFSPATATDVYNAISGYTETDSNVVASGTIGADFWNWLKEIGEVTESGTTYTFKDARGVARTGTMWPGAYQAN